MSAGYKAVLWNRQKRIYDRNLWLGIGIYLLFFSLISMLIHPDITAETLLIRATATAAFALLHLILLIGPLARLNRHFLPLLYNRRHMGVSMFVLALVHVVFSLIQFHALGNRPILVSVFLSNPNYTLFAGFPFELLGLIAFVILFLMAASSHDFWLKNLSPKIWKRLHMGVYFAYALLVGHVLLGVLQLEKDPMVLLWLGIGISSILVLHLLASRRAIPASQETEEEIRVGHFREIPPDRARIVRKGSEEIAVFRYGDQVSAVRNECKHQLGPLGEGKVVDGCITCPWHGYQYEPASGCAPPPFTERISTYALRLDQEGIIWVNPDPKPEGTAIPPVQLPKSQNHG